MDGSACYFSGSHICADAPIKEKKKKGYLIGKTSSHISKFYGRPRWDSTSTPPTKKKNQPEKQNQKPKNNKKWLCQNRTFFKLAQKWLPYFTQKNSDLSWMGWGRGEKFYFILFLYEEGGKKHVD